VKLQIVVTLAIALLAANTVSAQSPTESTDVPPVIDRGLKIPMIVWTAGVAADQITTYRFSSEYRDILHEQNPLVRGLDRHPTLLVAAGTAIDVATGWATYQFIGSRHPRLAKILFYGASAYRVYLAAYNIEMMRRASQLRAITSLRPTSSP
jgi:hypothetical protein